jgi:hypothetical protein
MYRGLVVEGRGLTKGKAVQQNTFRTQCREKDVPNALHRIRQAAIRNKGEKFTALLHHISPLKGSAQRFPESRGKQQPE